jgi:hypothetical protein
VNKPNNSSSSTNSSRFLRKKPKKKFASLLEQKPKELKGVFYLNTLNKNKKIINTCYIYEFLNKILKEHQKEGIFFSKK